MKKIVCFIFFVSFNLHASSRIYLNFSDLQCDQIIQNQRFFLAGQHSIDLIVGTYFKASSYIKEKNIKTPDSRLLAMYLGSELAKGVLTLKFKNEAQSILNSTSCIQTINRIPLEKTLLSYPGVKRIIYRLGNQTFEDFDA